MIKNLPFQHTEWFYLVLITGIILWCVFIWKEKSKYPNTKFFINSSIALIAIITLALLALKPLKFSASKPFKTVILTSDFKQNHLDSLKNIYNNLVITDYESGQEIINKSLIPESAFVLGNGIRSFDIWQLDSIKTTYLQGKESQGVIHINYPKKNKVGQRVVFKGRYHNAIEGRKLILENPSGKASDSIILSSEKEQIFELQADLNVAGNYTYNLVEKDSLERIVNSDPLPINVSGTKPLKILVVNDFPTFETKYLKNFLAKKGHQVLVRSQITKDRFKYEYFNLNSKPIVRFTKKALETFDLIIIDAIALNKLSRRQQNRIKTAVREDGLGIFIQPDIALFNSKNNIASFNFRNGKNSTSGFEKWPRIKVATYPYRFKKDASSQAIHLSNTNTLTAYKHLGLGNVGTFVFQNTYTLQLNGHLEAYQNLWSDIIEKLSKKELSNVAWESNSSLAFQDEPYDFALSTAIQSPSVSVNKALKVPLKQHPDMNSLWKGTTFPKAIGWQKLSIKQDTAAIFNFYVADSTKWLALKTYQTIKENKRQFFASDQLQKGDVKTAEPINLFYLYIVFILAMGYLWLEPKL